MREREPHKIPVPIRLAGLVAMVLLVVGYFLLPVDRFGPREPAISWTCFVIALTVIAVLLLVQIRAVLTDRQNMLPGMVIPVLMVLTILVFSTAYLALSKDPGEMDGLTSRLDALYFTTVTTATIGYGDITPRGQAARAVTILQVLYTVVFLSAAAAAFSQHVRSAIERRRADVTR